MTATTSFITQPPPNQVSKGPISAQAIMMNNDLGVWFMAAEGTPVDGVAGTGTGGGWAAPGSMYIDTVGANAYLNAGTKLSPVWKLITRAA